MVLFISVDGACDGHLIGSAEVTAHAGLRRCRRATFLRCA